MNNLLLLNNFKKINLQSILGSIFDFFKNKPKLYWHEFLGSSLHNKIYVGLLIATFVSMMWMSQSTPISGDEFRYHEHSKRVYNYFATGGKDKSANTDLGIDPMYYNPQTFDVVLLYVEKWFGIEDYMGMRHLFNALIGFFAILFTSLIALKFGGHRAAILSVLFLVLTPRFLGHCLNNHRDIPPVASYVFTIFILFKYYREYPKFKVKTFILLLIGLYSAYSIRLAGGLLLSAFVGLFMVCHHLYTIKFNNIFKEKSISILIRITRNVILISIIALFLASLLWPFIIENKIKGILETIKYSGDVQISLVQLFEGELTFSSHLPSYFSVKFMLISIPIFCILGFLLYIVSLIKEKFSNFNFLQFTFLFVLFFPLLYATFLVKVKYGGWRFFLIVYPFLVLLSVNGFLYFIKNQKKIIKYFTTGILVILLFLPLKFSIANHPYHYLYFNELVGGLKKAHKDYESDYGCHALYGGAKWIKENILPELKERDEKIKIITNSDHHLRYYLRKDLHNIQINYSRYYDKFQHDWDYAVFYLGYISPRQLKNNYWPPRGTIYKEKVDGVPIGIVMKNLSDEAYMGHKEIENGNLDKAIEHYKNFLRVYPKSEEGYLKIAGLYLTKKKYKKSVHYADKALLYHPSLKNALLIKGKSLTHLKEYDEAMTYTDRVIKKLPKNAFTEAYYIKALNLYLQKKPNEALKVLQKMFKLKNNYLEGNMLMADIHFNYQNYSHAEKLCKKVIVLNKNNLEPHIKLAYCYFFQNKTKELQQLLNSINRNDLAEIVALYCRINLKNGNLKDAKKNIELLKNIERNTFTYMARALYYKKINNFDQALNNARKAIKIDVNLAEAYMLMKEVKTQQHNTSQKK